MLYARAISASVISPIRAMKPAIVWCAGRGWRAGAINSGRAHLIDQRLEVRSQIPHLDGIAALGQIVLGSQQQPGASGIEPIDPRQIERHPPVRWARLSARSLRSRSAAVATSHSPAAARDKRSGFFRFDECSGDGRHAVQGFRLRSSAAERGLSNHRKSGYAATTDASIAATGSSRNSDHGPQAAYPIDT